MRIGVSIPNHGPLAGAPGPVALARVAEEEGADSVWVPDHLCIPREHSSRYPYSSDGTFPFPKDTPWFDCLTVLAAIAAGTDRIGLGTAILVLTQRNPVEVAKVASSLDQISGGRLRLGVAAGWLAEEIRALGYAPEGRGRRLDEAIAVLRDCWSGETSGFEGSQVSVEPGLVCLPRPVRGSVPLLVGGGSRRALERAALLGDGWIPGADIDMLDFDDLAGKMEQIAARRSEVGRAGLPFEQVLVVDAAPERAGGLPEVAVRASELGFDEIILELPFGDLHRAGATLASVRSALAG